MSRIVHSPSYLISRSFRNPATSTTCYILKQTHTHTQTLIHCSLYGQPSTFLFMWIIKLSKSKWITFQIFASNLHTIFADLFKLENCYNFPNKVLTEAPTRLPAHEHSMHTAPHKINVELKMCFIWWACVQCTLHPMHPTHPHTHAHTQPYTSAHAIVDIVIHSAQRNGQFSFNWPVSR